APDLLIAHPVGNARELAHVRDDLIVPRVVRADFIAEEVLWRRYGRIEVPLARKEVCALGAGRRRRQEDDEERSTEDGSGRSETSHVWPSRRLCGCGCRQSVPVREVGHRTPVKSGFTGSGWCCSRCGLVSISDCAIGKQSRTRSETSSIWPGVP